MKKLILRIILLTSILTFAQNKPKLVVGIVVDQMKHEYLNRFSSDFSENGFKRLINDGYSFQNVHYNYMPTYTAPGHAAIYTGTTPSVNGIVGNDWFNKATGKAAPEWPNHCLKESFESRPGFIHKDNKTNQRISKRNGISL